VAEGVGEGAGKVVEFAFFGVPLRGLPFAARPLRCTPSLLAQFASASRAAVLIRSIE